VSNCGTKTIGLVQLDFDALLPSSHGSYFEDWLASELLGAEIQICIIQMESTTTKTNYLPLVISGASGAGKVNKQTMQGSVVKFLIQRYPELFELSISLTTRPPR
jgi:hypothetical protein